MAKILVIEDDRTIAELLEVALEHEGHEVRLDTQGDPSRLNEGFDLVLLDLTLPEVDGVELARRIRAAYDLPIIMVTARGGLRDKLTGFEAGADDYITKPFRFEELSARIRAVLNRAGRGESRSTAGDLTLHLEERRAWWQGAALELTPREFDLLSALIQRPGRVRSSR